MSFDISPALVEIEANGVTPYDFGQRLLALGEFEKAIEWYQAVWLSTNDFQFLCGLAWAKYVSGDSYGAYKDAQRLLDKKLPPLIRARLLFLLGCVKTDMGELVEARQSLQSSLAAYEKMGKDGGKYLNLTMLAKLAVIQQDYDGVEPLLDQASAYNDKISNKGNRPFSKGRHLEIMGFMRFVQGDRGLAIELWEKSELAYREGGRPALAEMVRVTLLKTLPSTAAGEDATELGNTGQSPSDDKGSSQKRKKRNNATDKNLTSIGPSPGDENDS